MQESLNSIKSTQDKIHKLAGAANRGANSDAVGSVAKSLGIVMNEKDKHGLTKLGSNELIANTMAQRILAQVSQGKSK